MSSMTWLQGQGNWGWDGRGGGGTGSTYAPAPLVNDFQYREKSRIGRNNLRLLYPPFFTFNCPWIIWPWVVYDVQGTISIIRQHIFSFFWPTHPLCCSINKVLNVSKNDHFTTPNTHPFPLLTDIGMVPKQHTLRFPLYVLVLSYVLFDFFADWINYKDCFEMNVPF